MNVLSLFDGMSCGQIALQRAGIKVDNYFASEIDEYAIKVTQANYQNTKQLGSVTDLKVEDLPRIDLLIGGSPCQGFSFAGKMKGASTKCKIDILTLKQYLELKNDGFEFDGQSYLFWEYVRILNEVKKENKNVLFLLENVHMANKWHKMFNEAIGVKSIKINSSLVSAQNRERLYWTNIKNIGTIVDKNIKLKDIVEKEVDEKYFLSEKAIKYITDAIRIKKKYTSINGDKSICLMSQYNQSKNGTFLCVDANGRIDENKTGTLPQRYYKGVEKFGSSPFLYNGRFRKFTPKECERLQTVDDNYTDCVSDTQRYKMLGNGWTVDVISHIFKGLK